MTPSCADCQTPLPDEWQRVEIGHRGETLCLVCLGDRPPTVADPPVYRTAIGVVLSKILGGDNG